MRYSEHELIASVSRSSFYEFVTEFWQHIIPERPVWNWHIKHLCDKLQRMAERVFKGRARLKDLVINIPPGTTKSTICSIMFPAWVWTRMPHAKFLGVSYAHALSSDLSRKNRDIVKSDLYQKCFPEIQIRDDQDTKAYFVNTKGGVRYAAGVDGTVTGFHFHFIVIDDPLNPKQAASKADLETANKWIRETLITRKIDKRVTVSVLVMQRLHQDDPTALFLKRKRVEHLKLPAEACDGVKPESLVKEYRKGLLDPIRLPRRELKELEMELGQYGYSAQFRQNPVPPGGGMFKVNLLKKIERKDLPRKWKRVVRFWDKAGTLDGGTYTVGTKMGHSEEGKFFVLDVIRVQLDSWQRERLIRETAISDGFQTRVGIEQEGASGGKESAENTVGNLLGFRVKVQKTGRSDGDKANRADPFSSQVNAGNVYYVKDHWNQEFIEELRYFPFSRYKDQVDSSAGAFNMLHRKRKRVGALR